MRERLRRAWKMLTYQREYRSALAHVDHFLAPTRDSQEAPAEAAEPGGNK